MRGRRSRTGRAGRLAVLAALVAALVVLPAVAAHADPARPTNYRSTVTDLDPPTDAVTVEVVGGDAFLRVEVQPGHTVTVYGYQDEPYLRIDEDGAVAANLNSPAHYLNQDRYAAVSPPERADPDTEPDWEVVGTDGTYTWHDHRIHWMGLEAPRSVSAGAGVQPVTEVSPWEFPITVAGTDTMVRGELVWVPSRVSVVAVVVGIAVAALAWLLGRRGTRVRALVVAVSATAATVVAVAEAAVQPEGFLASWSTWAPPAVALLLAAGAVLGATRREVRTPLVIAGGLVGVWLVRRMSVLWLPLLPTALTGTAARVLTATAAGLLLGLLGQAVYDAATTRPSADGSRGTAPPPSGRSRAGAAGS